MGDSVKALGKPNVQKEVRVDVDVNTDLQKSQGRGRRREPDIISLARRPGQPILILCRRRREGGKGWHPPPRCGEVMNGPIRRHEIKHLLCESRQWKIYAASGKSCSSSSAAWGAEELAAKLATYMFRRL